MNITIEDQKVYIEMKDQIREVIEWGKLQGGCKPPNPAKTDMFDMDKSSSPLSEKDSCTLHSVVQKLPYITKRTRADIETAISFLCIRVSNPTHEDKINLTRVLGYLENTIDLVRTIGASSFLVLSSWVDASYAVHKDMRSHTSGLMSFVTGTIHSKSSKQKLNIKSSTEAELVGVSEYLPYHFWLMNVMKVQEINIEKKLSLQDNQSAIRMERNGWNSCTGNSRHINKHFFFLKDCVDSGDIKNPVLSH